MHFELGGKNPVIVFDDADLERALDAVIFMIYSLNGERCTSSSRLLVQDSVADSFEARLIEQVKAISDSHLDPATEISPLIHETHFAKVTGAFRRRPRGRRDRRRRRRAPWRGRLFRGTDAVHSGAQR